MLSLHDALFDEVGKAIDKVLAQYLGRPTMTPEQILADAKKGGAAKGKRKPVGKVTKWAATPEAKRVPLFVQRDTKLKTKAAVLAKYGTALFEDGKPLPPVKTKAAPKKKAAKAKPVEAKSE